jgi:hypothetical protein
MVEEINALTPGSALVANQGWAEPIPHSIPLLGPPAAIDHEVSKTSCLPSWPDILIVTEKIRAVVCVFQGR